MRPTTEWCIGHAKFTSVGTADIQTTGQFPKGTSHVLIAVETNPIRMTFDGSDPTAGVGPIMPNGVPPWLLTIGQGAVIRFVSTVAGNGVMQISYLQ